MSKRALCCLLCAVLYVFQTGTAPASGEINTQIVLKPGFHISLFAEDVPGARSLARGPHGTVFVGTRDNGHVYALRDIDGDGVADSTYILASNLRMPNGVAVLDGALFVAEIDRVSRLDSIEFKLSSPPTPIVINNSFPADESHGWKFIAFGPDGWLYVPVGAPCNVCERDNVQYASIMRMKPDGTALEVYAHGVRNSVGFDWHPESGELWFTDNGRDMMGDHAPPDELNRAPRAGLHFGFPYCHGGHIPDPRFGKQRDCDEFTPPTQLLPAHVASLGMRFYRGSMFPAEYQNQILIAEHGSWNSTVRVGYRLTRVTLSGTRAVRYDVFVDGWLGERGITGRPVDLLELPDGSLLVSDDYRGAVYRITYRAADTD